MQHLEDHPKLQPTINTALIEQQLFLVAEYLRELLDHDSIDTQKIEALEQHIETLDKVIQDSL